MVDNQTQTSNYVPEKYGKSKEAEAENITGFDTSDEESVVEVILEDKTPQQEPQHNSQAPLGGELKKDTPLAYHHPHHPARK